MSFHIWRKIYWTFGWEYPEPTACERQKHLKHELNKQIVNSNLKLKPINGVVVNTMDQNTSYLKPKKRKSKTIKRKNKKD